MTNTEYFLSKEIMLLYSNDKNYTHLIPHLILEVQLI
jgi:hypothetical protein